MIWDNISEAFTINTGIIWEGELPELCYSDRENLVLKTNGPGKNNDCFYNIHGTDR